MDHHEDRCGLIRSAMATQPRSVVDLLPRMLRSDLTPHEMRFAFAEVLAPANYLVARREIAWQDNAKGTRMIVPAS